MVYFSKKQASSLGYSKQEADTKFAKLSLANTFTNNNTFNNPIVIGGNIALKKSGQEVSDIEITNQNEKTIHFDFIQPTSGFRNYCNVDFRIKQGTGNFETGFKIQIQDAQHDLIFSTDCVAYSFNNKEIKGVATPTANTSVANKTYVDNKVKLIEKSGFSFTRQQLNTTSGNEVTKYYATMTYTTIGITNTSQILSCYLKSIPSQGQHLVVTFFGEYNTDTLLVEIYQYNNTSDITNDLNRATFRIGYINS